MGRVFSNYPQYPFGLHPEYAALRCSSRRIRRQCSSRRSSATPGRGSPVLHHTPKHTRYNEQQARSTIPCMARTACSEVHRFLLSHPTAREHLRGRAPAAALALPVPEVQARRRPPICICAPICLLRCASAGMCIGIAWMGYPGRTRSPLYGKGHSVEWLSFRKHPHVRMRLQRRPARTRRARGSGAASARVAAVGCLT